MTLPIRVYIHVNELANWNKVIDQQFSCMIHSGLLKAADQVVLLCNGRPATFTPILETYSEYKNIRLEMVSPNATLWEYPSILFLHRECRAATEPFHFCYFHLKGLTHWGKKAVDDWREWLNWCVIERWEENVEALQTHDTSGPNWELIPWPHHSANFWWANSQYAATLDELIHPHKLMSTGTTQFKAHGHWRFDCEAWIGSKNPNAFEIARSFEQGGDHYHREYPRELYRTD